MSSLINFLNPKLKPGVECDAICEDGYSVGNLVAEDNQRGFMAFSVTKPPVDIIFDFPKALDLKVIKLWNNIGAFRSTSFEVHGKHNGIWERVAFVRDLSKGVDSVTFCYACDYNRRSNTGTDSEQLCSEKVFFFKTAPKILSNTNSIKITIRGTQKCPPVLRKVEVWGLPSRSLDIGDRELVRTIWSETTIDDKSEMLRGQRSPSRHVPELNENSTLAIPEEFLDSITWELMTFPTVLPSGKVVDQSTIDKHSEVEARWGRLPSDPFTGLEFTPQRKAILNLGLKSRIEKFLMEKANHFKTVPRSLGSSRVRRSKNRHASQFASLNSTAGTYSCLLGKTHKTTTATCTSLSTSPQPAKRTKLSSSSTNATATTRTDIPLYTSLPREKSTASTMPYSTVSSTAMIAAQSFLSGPTTGQLDAGPSSSSIDRAIQEALSKVTRFTQTRPKETAPEPCCISCKANNFTYEIATCKHLVCRKCLVNLTQEKLCTCKTAFESSDVERYHRLQ